jgi:hypothetical protein
MTAACRIVDLPPAEFRAQRCQPSGPEGARDEPGGIIGAEDVDQTKEPVAGDQDMIDIAHRENSACSMACSHGRLGWTTQSPPGLFIAVSKFRIKVPRS